MKKLVLCFIIVWNLLSCNEKKELAPTEAKVLPIKLTSKIAENLCILPLKCLQKEYPNKLNQTLGSAVDLASPKNLHPTFYGCFDWHSSVHGHWMLIKLLKLFPEISKKEEIKTLLIQSITPENILAEVAYFDRIGEKSFERTYGWAWILKLQQELNTWNDPMAKSLSLALQPLSNLMVQKYEDFLPKLQYPVRSGEHPNTAFGLVLAYDYAQSQGLDTLEQLITSRARDYFLLDQNCPMDWEPGGFDFLSPCLQEAELMSKILPRDTFKIWLSNFLPKLTDSNFSLTQAKVSDRTDGKLVHLDGVNFCRAWSLYSIASTLPEYNHLIKIANQHIEASLPNVADGGYEGEHWLASFAILALSEK